MTLQRLPVSESSLCFLDDGGGSCPVEKVVGLRSLMTDPF